MNKFYTIVDFDTPLYGSSTILQDNYIEVTHIKSGRIKEFKNITEFIGRGKKIGGWLADTNKEKNTNFTKEDFVIENKSIRNNIPLSKAQEFVISSAEAIRDKEWCDKIRFVISGEDNYRKKLNLLYKANRPLKPIMYKELREWFIETYKDEIIIADGCEADDILSIFGWWGYNKALKSGNYEDNNICLSFIDKDIFQVPGWYWNFKSKKEKPEWQTELKASKCFWVQMLQGDTTDNIPGLDGTTKEIWDKYKLKGKKLCVGNKNALTILSNCDTKEELEERVKYLYMAYYCDIWEDKFQEAYQMLKLQTNKGIIPKYEFKG